MTQLGSAWSKMGSYYNYDDYYSYLSFLATESGFHSLYQLMLKDNLDQQSISFIEIELFLKS